MEDLFERRDGIIGGGTQNNAIRPIEVFNGATWSEEDRLRNDGRAQAGIAQASLNDGGTAHRNRSKNGKNRRLGRETRNTQRVNRAMVGHDFCKENYLLI